MAAKKARKSRGRSSRGKWRSKIVGHDRVDPTTLAPHPTNPRTHPEQQDAVVRASIREHGVVKSILVNRTTGHVLDGHERLDLALADKEPLVDVEYVEIPAKQEAAVLLSLDSSAAMAGWDRESLESLLEEVETKDESLTALFDDLASQAGIGGEEDGPEPRPAQSDRIDELQQEWGTEEGQMWEIPGRNAWTQGLVHRIVCGDSTDAKSYADLMRSERARCVFTDPPYGVNYQAEGHQRIANDDLQRGDLVALLAGAMRQAQGHVIDEGAFYIWHSGATEAEFRRAMESVALVVKQTIIWDKVGMVLGHDHYQWAHEPCFYAHNDGHVPEWFGKRTETTVWHVGVVGDAALAVAIGRGLVITDGDRSVFMTPEIPAKRKMRTQYVDEQHAVELWPDKTDQTVWRIRRDAKPLHPTQKPVGLAKRALRNSTRPSEIVIDMFGGSGSTMLGAELSGRIARLIELDPRYVALTLERMRDLGCEPQRVGAEA